MSKPKRPSKITANAVADRDDSQRKLLHRLRRAEGQLRAVTELVAADAPCEGVAQQLSAVRAALDKAYFELMACAMADAAAAGADTRDSIDELKDVLVRYA